MHKRPALAGHIVSVALAGLSCAAMGHDDPADSAAGTAPLVYVERCAFKYEGAGCGLKSRNVVFLSSDEFLSATDNWAVGRAGNYKLYLSWGELLRSTPRSRR